MIAFAAGIHPQTRKKIERVLDTGERLAAVLKDAEQWSVFYDEKSNSLMLLNSHVDQVENRIDRYEKCHWAPLSREPWRFDQGSMDEDQLAFLQKFLGRIWSKKNPNPTQLKNMEMLVQNPDAPLTQALLKVCQSSTCLCPLALSPLGCFYTTKCVIEPKDKENPKVLRLGYEDDILDRKVIRNGISALRQQIKYPDLIPELQKHVSLEDFKLGE